MENKMKVENTLTDLTFIVVIGFGLSYFFGYLNFANFVAEFNVYCTTFAMVSEMNLSTEYYIFAGVRFFFLFLIPLCAVSFSYHRELWDAAHTRLLTLMLPCVYWYLTLLTIYLVAIWYVSMVPFPFGITLFASLFLLGLILILAKYRHQLCQGSFIRFLLICFAFNLWINAYLAILSGKYEARNLYNSVLQGQTCQELHMVLQERCGVQVGSNPAIFAQTPQAIYVLSRKSTGQVEIDMIPRSYINYLSVVKKR